MASEAKNGGKYTLLIGEARADGVISDNLSDPHVPMYRGSGAEGVGSETAAPPAGSPEDPDERGEVTELGLNGKPHLGGMNGAGSGTGSATRSDGDDGNLGMTLEGDEELK